MTGDETPDYVKYGSGLFKGQGLTPLDRWNNLHPDDRRRDFLKKKRLIVLKDGRTKEKPKKRGRGRPRGSSGSCSYCGQPGHYVRSCPELYDIGE